jgi:polyhydroxyalkanoate synthesis regulator protein
MEVVRYGNRKMYCYNTKRYISLADLAQAISSGENVKVTSHLDKSDITLEMVVAAFLQKTEFKNEIYNTIMSTRINRE